MTLKEAVDVPVSTWDPLSNRTPPPFAHWQLPLAATLASAGLVRIKKGHAMFITNTVSGSGTKLMRVCNHRNSMVQKSLC